MTLLKDLNEAKDEMSVDDLLDQIDDIMSSGQGEDMTNWHRRELTKLIKPLTTQTKSDLFTTYTNNIVKQEGWTIEEINLIGKLCGAKNIKLKITYS